MDESADRRLEEPITHSDLESSVRQVQTGELELSAFQSMVEERPLATPEALSELSDPLDDILRSLTADGQYELLQTLNELYYTYEQDVSETFFQHLLPTLAAITEVNSYDTRLLDEVLTSLSQAEYIPCGGVSGLNPDELPRPLIERAVEWARGSTDAKMRVGVYLQTAATGNSVAYDKLLGIAEGDGATAKDAVFPLTETVRHRVVSRGESPSDIPQRARTVETLRTNGRTHPSLSTRVAVGHGLRHLNASNPLRRVRILLGY